jgi:hypothetical protein
MPGTAETLLKLEKQATVGTHVSVVRAQVSTGAPAAESPPTKGMPTTATRISAKVSA